MWGSGPCPHTAQVPVRQLPGCFPGGGARSTCAHAPDRSQPGPQPAETVTPRGRLSLWILTTLNSWTSHDRTVWPAPDALNERRCGSPDLWLCYYCVLEFLQPCAPWRIPALSLGRISQTAEEISKMLGTSCVRASPPGPRYWQPFVCGQREEETD